MVPIQLVNIYETIAEIPAGGSYKDAQPRLEGIHYMNGLFLREEAIVIYITNIIDANREMVKEQLNQWGCMYHRLQVPRSMYQTASTFNIPTSYGHRFGFDANTCVHVFRTGPGYALGPRSHHYKECHLYVLHGRFLYAWLDADSGDVYTETVEPGAILHIHPRRIYTIEALTQEGGSILQRSTHPEDEDNHSL